MTIAVGLLLLSCGWIFYSSYFPTKARSLRGSDHSQYFGAVICAFLIAAPVMLMHYTATDQCYLYEHLVNYLSRIASPLDAGEEIKVHTNILIGMAICALPTTIIAIIMLNLPYQLSHSLKYMSIKKHASEVERVLLYSIEKGVSCAITLSTGKVYIGIPAELDQQNENKLISIFPLASGYRDECGRLKITTSYGSQYKFEDGGHPFFVSLPMDSVIALQNFSLALYANQQSMKTYYPIMPAMHARGGRGGLNQLTTPLIATDHKGEKSIEGLSPLTLLIMYYTFLAWAFISIFDGRMFVPTCVFLLLSLLVLWLIERQKQQMEMDQLLTK